jgi:hypothetical protein
MTFALWAYVLFQIAGPRWGPLVLPAFLVFGLPLMWAHGRDLRRTGRGYFLALSALLAVGVTWGWPLAAVGVVVFSVLAGQYGRNAR